LRSTGPSDLDGFGVELDLQSVEHRLVVAQAREFSSVDPGYARR
jgi:hypothetical protein